MANPKIVYQCQSCGYVSPKWLGRCPDCGQWNSLVEERPSSGRATRSRSKAEPRLISSIKEETGKRTSTHIAEFDRVLGGGIVAGSVILVGGDPGIGKSTMLLQAAAGLKGGVLYVSGEESPEQIKIRADRLSIKSDTIALLPETDLENIIDAAEGTRPAAIIIDSIQTMYTGELPSAPGSVGQVRECATKLMFFAKKSGIPVFIVGHVTKEGAIAGPRVLEHIVDTVLYFEGDRGHSYRILRAVKNRFGSTNEIGVFEMTDSGLSEIENPSELFLSERPANAAGSLVVSSIEGTRPLLVEIQALVTPTSFGMPRRAAIGMDFQRVSLLIAVLEKIAGLHLGGMDIFTNVVGGLKIAEPAMDLGAALAIASSLRELPVPPDLFVFGEVGLSGEIRAVSQAELRLKEAAKIGFRKAVISKTNSQRLKDTFGLDITGAGNLREALEAIGL
ncbi:MAG: DNA repair protein RadA [Thermodesulfovibrionales bacterium]|nr:DNA repair protein RadA [Thermodesulfovibrionales bacterium]